MSVTTNGPATHTHRLIRPMAYRATIANPPRVPRPVILRASCGHVLGVGYVSRRRQGFISWRSTRLS